MHQFNLSKRQRKPNGKIKNGQSRDTGNIGTHNTQKEDNKRQRKPRDAIGNGQSRDTDNIGTQDTGRRQKQKQKHKTQKTKKMSKDNISK